MSELNTPSPATDELAPLPEILVRLPAPFIEAIDAYATAERNRVRAAMADKIALLHNECANLDADKEKLRDALARVLKLGRGTSGRIILELSDEADLRAALARPAAEQSAWISVDDERKPEFNAPVLMFVRTVMYGEMEGERLESHGTEIAMGEYRLYSAPMEPCFECFSSPMSDNDWITHWMPLPQPPGAERSPVEQVQAQPLTYTVDGEVLSPLEYIDHLHGEITTLRNAMDVAAAALDTNKDIEELKAKYEVQAQPVARLSTKELLALYDENKGDWCAIARAVEDRYTAPAQPLQVVAVPEVDCLGLALDLEAQAKRVESQTVERAMLAAAHGLRLMLASPSHPSTQPAAQAGEVRDAEEWSYSMDEESYSEQEGSRAAILAHVIAVLGTDFNGTFWIGRNLRFKPRIRVDFIIELLQEQAHDECGEYAETYLEDVTKAEEAELADFITAWASHVDRSNFWTVTDVEQHTIESAQSAIDAAMNQQSADGGEHGTL